MSTTLANAPVYYTLVQVRFDAVVSMSKFVGDIQERLRLNGYPVFETDIIQSLSISLTGESSDMPVLSQENQWYFTSSDRSCGYVLGHGFLTFHATKYSTHEKFFKDLSKGIALLNEIVQIPSINRIGLRYLNAVLPKGDETVEGYLHPNVHGIQLENDWLSGSSESVFPTEEGILISKVYKASYSQLGFPADLQFKSLILQDRFLTKDPLRHAVIDIDHYSEAVLPPNSDLIENALNILHEGTSECFKKIATPYAFERWS